MHTGPLASGNVGERADGDAVLAQLAKRFEDFRANNARRTRLPADLRSAVLEAVDAGVPVHAIRCTCGVSTSQLARWLGGRAQRGASRAVASTDSVRVFPVEETPSAQPRTEQTLILQLGAWEISIRLAGAPPTTRS